MSDRPDRSRYLSGVHRLVVKLGSGVLTKDDQLDQRVMGRLADEISLLSERGLQFVVISSGAVATGAQKLGLKVRPRLLPELQAAAAVGQARLMQEYEAVFDRYGLKVAQILLTRDDLTHRQRFLNARNTLIQLLEWKVLPIINENDTTSVDELKFGDNDNLSVMIANMIQADLYVNLTRVEGFFSGNPILNGRAELIDFVEEMTPELEARASAEVGAFNLGGMLSKVRAAHKAALAGIPAVIASGKRENVLREVLSGQAVGTFFAPKKALPGRKHWIAFTLKSRGEVVIDQGACLAVVERGKSLLPSGVIEVRGEFGVGDQVRVVDAQGRPVAVGLSNYSSADLDRIKGRKTGDILPELGYKGYDEVIHRDNMFVPEKEDEALCHLLM